MAQLCTFGGTFGHNCAYFLKFGALKTCKVLRLFPEQEIFEHESSNRQFNIRDAKGRKTSSERVEKEKLRNLVG